MEKVRISSQGSGAQVITENTGSATPSSPENNVSKAGDRVARPSYQYVGGNRPIRIQQSSGGQTQGTPVRTSTKRSYSDAVKYGGIAAALAAATISQVSKEVSSINQFLMSSLIKIFFFFPIESQER